MLKKSLLITALCLIPLHTSSTEVTTGNLLTNSTFGTGTQYSDTGWDVTGFDSHHDDFSGAGGNNPGGSFAAGVDSEISQTVKLTDDAGMNVKEIQNGWSSTIGADIWFWNSYDNKVTLKQEITGSDGSTTTQQRTISTNCGLSNCNQYNNYTDTHIQGANTQTDYDIKVIVTNEGAGYTSGHLGPDIDDVTLSVSYTDLALLEDDAQEAIDDIKEPVVEISEDMFKEEFKFEEYKFEDYEVSSAFETESFEEVVTEDFQEFEVAETMEEPTYEEELEEPDSIMEEPSGETFDEEPEPKTEEVQDEDTMDESGETMEEEPANEGSASEVAKNEDEEMEEGESDSEDTEDTEVQTAEGSSEKKVSSTEAKAKLSEDVGGTSVNLKTVEKQLSTLDKLLIQPELDEYKEVAFYESKDIYLDSNLELFENQVDLGAYSVAIYTNVSLSDYTLNDPMEIFNNRIEFLARQKLSIMIELRKLKEN